MHFMFNLGTEVIIGEACEDSWSYHGRCDGVVCNNECKERKGGYAKGRCMMIDTCVCVYPC